MPGSYTSELYDQQHNRGYWDPKNFEEEKTAEISDTPESGIPINPVTQSSIALTQNITPRIPNPRDSLTGLLRKVESLKRDLPEELVEQEEIGHIARVTHTNGYTETSGGGYWNDYETEEWIIDQPRIVRKNPPEKREAARKELQLIYDSSEWYSARYVAARDLGINVNKDLVNNWVSLLNSVKPKINVKVGEHQEYTDTGYAGPSTVSRVTTGDWSTVEDFKVVSNSENYKKARLDLHYLKKLQRIQSEKIDLYLAYQFNKDPIIRKKAGKALGYSPMRIWAHEHPVSATIVGCTTVGATSGLGYMLYQYLTK
jgi:hypothetical protein